MSVLRRVRLPPGADVLVGPGHAVEPAEVLATYRAPGAGVNLPVAARLRRSPADARAMLAVTPGARLDAGELLAGEGGGREVRVETACLFLAWEPDDGTALVAPLGDSRPIIGHVRGQVTAVTTNAIEVRVDGAMLTGVGGSGGAVHGELTMAVREAADELRAGAIDVAAAGKILVGGSRASAETLTRARAMGAAGIVLGGLLDKELRDFESAQARRREVGAGAGEFAIVALEGFGKVGMSGELFAWFAAHAGRTASVFGADATVYVYDATSPPGRRVLPRPGERVVGLRQPFAGVGGELLHVVDGLYATPAGVAARSAVVRFDDGRTAIVPLANLEAADRHRGA